MEIIDDVFVYRLKDENNSETDFTEDQIKWHGRFHAHEQREFELHYFLEGEGSFQCNKSRYTISSGSVYLVGPNEFHSIFTSDLSKPITFYAVLFSLNPESEEDMKIISALDYSLNDVNRVLKIDSKHRFTFEEILQLSRSDDERSKEISKHLLISLLYRFFGADTLSISTNAVKNTRKRHVDKALQLMEKNVKNSIRIEDISKRLMLSEEHFIRIFKEEMRMTPQQYFKRLKVEGASAMLMSSSKTIGEISDIFGFENQFHFSRVFKKCTGLSPLEYRKSYIQKADFNLN